MVSSLDNSDWLWMVLQAHPYPVAHFANLLAANTLFDGITLDEILL